MAMTFRVVRLLRLFRLYKLFQHISEVMVHKEVSYEVAQHMMVVDMLVNFVHAHLRSQQDFAKYFGVSKKGNFTGDIIENPEVARCILQSQVALYQAIALAVDEERQLDPLLLAQVNANRQAKRIAQELEHFVVEAHQMGAIGQRDAEAILHPVHNHIAKCQSFLADVSDGILDQETDTQRKELEASLSLRSEVHDRDSTRARCSEITIAERAEEEDEEAEAEAPGFRPTSLEDRSEFVEVEDLEQHFDIKVPDQILARPAGRREGRIDDGSGDAEHPFGVVVVS
mmetsp:Transcript_52385/g.170006  ORF Transcript_52385/g.170006 Transcript_52385/m.170006 type:complete len:285 (-) Transcript_52385:158-1012(-)